MAHNEECLWNRTHSTCQPRVVGRQPGFKGPRRANNHHLPQFLRNANGERGGKLFKGNWQQPVEGADAEVNDPGDNAGHVAGPGDNAGHVAGPGDNAGHVAGPGDNAGHAAVDADGPGDNAADADGVYRSRYGRLVRTPRRFQGGDLVDAFTGQELTWLDGTLHTLENFQGGHKASDGRRFRNFVHLTSF